MRSNPLKSRVARGAAAATVAGIALTGCTSTTAASTVASDCTPKDADLTTYTEGTLTVGVPENMPYTQTQGTDASGMEIDLVKKMAEAECLNIAFVAITYANGIPMISEQKRTDMITGGWYVTEARAEQVASPRPRSTTRWASCPRPAPRRSPSWSRSARSAPGPGSPGKRT